MSYQIGYFSQGSIYNPMKMRWETIHTNYFKAPATEEQFKEMKKNSVPLDFSYKIEVIKAIKSCRNLEQIKTVENWIKDLNLSEEMDTHIQDQLVVIANK